MCGSVRWRAGRCLVAEDPACHRRRERRAGVCIDTRSMGVVLIACVQRCPPWARRFVRWRDPRAATESTATPLPGLMPSACHSSGITVAAPGVDDSSSAARGGTTMAASSRPSSRPSSLALLAALPTSNRHDFRPLGPRRAIPAQHTCPYSLCARARGHFNTPPRLEVKRKRERRQREAARCASRRSAVPRVSHRRQSAHCCPPLMRRCVDGSNLNAVACFVRRPTPGPSFPHHLLRCPSKQNLRGRRLPRPWSRRSPSRRGWRRRRSGPCWPRAPSAWWRAPRRRSCRPQRARRRGRMGGRAG